MKTKVNFQLLETVHQYNGKIDIDGIMIGDIIIGKPFRLWGEDGPLYTTTNVIEIVDSTTFKTINSTYKITKYDAIY